jgi:hypothetical protein
MYPFRIRPNYNKYCHVCVPRCRLQVLNMDGVWIDNRIYWTLRHTEIVTAFCKSQNSVHSHL